MYAKIVNDKVAFKHLGGVFCIKISSMPCESGTLTLATDQKLCGAFTTSLTEDIPELKTEDETVIEGNTVSIAFTNASLNKPGVFYIPVPTGTYTNTSVTLKTQTGNELTETKTVLTVNAGKYEVKRADLKKIELKTVTIETEESTKTTEVKTVAEAQTALETSDNVTVTGTVNEGESVIIPKVTEENNNPKTLNLKSVFAGRLDVTEATTETSYSSVKDFTLSIPYVHVVNLQPSTNTTLTLAAYNGTTNIYYVFADGGKLLIFDNGITITTLNLWTNCKVVRINKDVKVGSIIRNNTTPTVYYEEGASIPTDVAGVNFIKIKVGEEIPQ